MSEYLKASRASTIDLELDAKLNKIAENAVPKEIPDPPPIKHRRAPQTSIMRSSQYTGDLDIRDMLLDAQVEKIAQGAIPVDAGWKPSKINSPVTQQMIDEAREEIQKPLEINGQTFRYRPASMPLPDLDAAPVLNQVYTPDELRQFRADKKVEVDDITRRVANIKQLDEDEKILDADYSIQKPLFDAREQELRSMKKAKQNQVARDLGLKFRTDIDENIQAILKKEFGTPDMQTDYETQKLHMSDARDVEKGAIAAAEAVILALDIDLKNNDQIINDNRALVFENERINSERLNAYASDMNALNSGVLSLAQLSGESAEDYRTRLEETGQAQIPQDELEHAASLLNFTNAKNNLQQLINDKGKIETIAKMLSPENRFLMNKQFPRIKKTFTDTYGINNKAVSEQDVVDLVMEVIQSPIVAAPVPARHAAAPPVPPEPLAVGPAIVGPAVVGAGIGTHNYPKLSRFGKVSISPDKLYYKNTLVIKSPHGKAITGLKNTRVSDAMVSILLKILDGGKVGKSELNLLSAHEKQLYDTLMVMSGGHKIHENSIDNTTREMKHRLNLIGGEMDAGNNSEILLKELHALLHRMAHSGLISTPAAAKYYREVKSNYY